VIDNKKLLKKNSFLILSKNNQKELIFISPWMEERKKFTILQIYRKTLGEEKMGLSGSIFPN